jgi:hypothetical protein
MSDRTRRAFQTVTVSPALSFPPFAAPSSPGSMPGQGGPSALISLPGSGGGLGDMPPSIFTFVQSVPVPTAPTAHPDSVPPIGPEERIRYSCVSGKCLQDPNGIYLGIDECLSSGCGSSTGGGGGGGGGGSGGNGCDCGCGPSQTVLKATVTGASGPFTSGARTYWQYGWSEVGGGGRTSAVSGTAINEYELSYDNNGGNVVPGSALVNRLRIPTGAIVDLMLDENCVPWFNEPNPLSVTCV